MSVNLSMHNSFSIDKSQVAQSFGLAASHYDDVAVLQRQTADELLIRMDALGLTPETVVDLGAGTGRNLPLLAQRFINAEITAIDLAEAMLEKAKQQAVAGVHYRVDDAENLSLADNSVDLIYANLSLQWCQPQRCFSEISRVLKPGGVVAFTSLGPDTLNELKAAWTSVDDYQHVNQFYSVDTIEQAIKNSRLDKLELEQDIITLKYHHAIDLMKDLKTLGAHNVTEGRRRGLTGKTALQKVINTYEQFRNDNGLLPASYQVIYGLMRKQA